MGVINQLITGGYHIVPYMFGLFFRPRFQGISLQNMARNMVLTYLHFRILFYSHWMMVGWPCPFFAPRNAIQCLGLLHWWYWNHCGCGNWLQRFNRGTYIRSCSQSQQHPRRNCGSSQLVSGFITPVINGISRVNPLITGVITHLLSGMSHQVEILWCTRILGPW